VIKNYKSYLMGDWYFGEVEVMGYILDCLGGLVCVRRRGFGSMDEVLKSGKL